MNIILHFLCVTALNIKNPILKKFQELKICHQTAFKMPKYVFPYCNHQENRQMVLGINFTALVVFWHRYDRIFKTPHSNKPNPNITQDL